MYKITVNNKVFELEHSPEGYTLAGEPVNPDLVQVSEGNYHLLLDNKGYRVQLNHRDDKMFTLQVNGNLYRIQIKDKYDNLLEELGLDSAADRKTPDIKAPMPGKVISVLVEAGAQVQEGTPLLVLEAMKMENVLKAPATAVIKSINVKIGDAVEKGAALIVFSN